MTSINSFSQQDYDSISNIQDEEPLMPQGDKMQRGRNSQSLPQDTIQQILMKVNQGSFIKKQEDNNSCNHSQISSQMNQFCGNSGRMDLSNYSNLQESHLNEFSYDDEEENQNKNITIGGIPLQNIYENSEWIKPFLCFLCSNVAVQPIRCSNCSGLFCRGCLNNWENRSEIKKQCPKCQQLQSFNISQQEVELKPDYNTQKFLQDINVDCVYKKNGCQEIVSYAEYEDHIKNCPKRSKICLNCGENFVFDQAELHKNLCQLQSVLIDNKSISEYSNRPSLGFQNDMKTFSAIPTIASNINNEIEDNNQFQSNNYYKGSQNLTGRNIKQNQVNFKGGLDSPHSLIHLNSSKLLKDKDEEKYLLSRVNKVSNQMAYQDQYGRRSIISPQSTYSSTSNKINEEVQNNSKQKVNLIEDQENDKKNNLANQASQLNAIQVQPQQVISINSNHPSNYTMMAGLFCLFIIPIIMLSFMIYKSNSDNVQTYQAFNLTQTEYLDIKQMFNQQYTSFTEILFEKLGAISYTYKDLQQKIDVLQNSSDEQNRQSILFNNTVCKLDQSLNENYEKYQQNFNKISEKINLNSKEIEFFKVNSTLQYQQWNKLLNEQLKNLSQQLIEQVKIEIKAQLYRQAKQNEANQQYFQSQQEQILKTQMQQIENQLPQIFSQIQSGNYDQLIDKIDKINSDYSNLSAKLTDLNDTVIQNMSIKEFNESNSLLLDIIKQFMKDYEEKYNNLKNLFEKQQENTLEKINSALNEQINIISQNSNNFKDTTQEYTVKETDLEAYRLLFNQELQQILQHLNFSEQQIIQQINNQTSQLYQQIDQLNQQQNKNYENQEKVNQQMLSEIEKKIQQQQNQQSQIQIKEDSQVQVSNIQSIFSQLAILQSTIQSYKQQQERFETNFNDQFAQINSHHQDQMTFNLKQKEGLQFQLNDIIERIKLIEQNHQKNNQKQEFLDLINSQFQNFTQQILSYAVSQQQQIALFEKQTNESTKLQQISQQQQFQDLEKSISQKQTTFFNTIQQLSEKNVQQLNNYKQIQQSILQFSQDMKSIVGEISLLNSKLDQTIQKNEEKLNKNDNLIQEQINSQDQNYENLKNQINKISQQNTNLNIEQQKISELANQLQIQINQISDYYQNELKQFLFSNQNSQKPQQLENQNSTYYQYQVQFQNEINEIKDKLSQIQQQISLSLQDNNASQKKAQQSKEQISENDIQKSDNKKESNSLKEFIIEIQQVQNEKIMDSSNIVPSIFLACEGVNEIKFQISDINRCGQDCLSKRRQIKDENQITKIKFYYAEKNKINLVSIKFSFIFTSDLWCGKDILDEKETYSQDLVIQQAIKEEEQVKFILNHS